MPGGKKSPGRRPRREQRPEGKKKCFREKPGPQAQREQHPEGEKKCFREKPGPQAQKKHSQLKNPARRAEEIF